jgi:hypothetical protein
MWQLLQDLDVLHVLPSARVQPAAGDFACQSEGVVEVAAGEESGITGVGRPLELERDFAIKIDAVRLILADSNSESVAVGWRPVVTRSKVGAVHYNRAYCT